MRIPQRSCPQLSLRGATFLCIAGLMLTSLHASAQQLTSSVSTLHFGTVPIGQTETQFISLTNNGTTSVNVTAMSITIAEFSVSGLTLPASIGPGQSLGLNVTFSPSSLGWTGGKIDFASTASNPNLVVQIAGTGVTSDCLTASPANISFGKVAVGSTASTTVTLTNTRTSELTLTSFQPIGSAFSVDGASLPVVLKPGQSTQVTIAFTPQAAGKVGGSIFIPTPGLNIPLSGVGITAAQLSVSPASLSFGNVIVGETGTQSVVLSATGGNVTLSSISSSSSQFSAAGVSLPLTLGSGQSVALNVDFTPQNAGSTSGTLSFASNAQDNPLTESAAGTGVAAVVSLTWNPSTSQVSGYNVYRSTTSGGSFAKINGSLDSSTSFSDATVAAGQTYYYVTTAVNSKGQESAYSNEVEVAIP